MVIHRDTCLTPYQKQEIYKSYYENKKNISDPAAVHHVSRHKIYKIVRQSRHKDFTIHKSINKRFRSMKYGIKWIAKVEAELEAKRKN